MSHRTAFALRCLPGPLGAWLLLLVLVFAAAQLHGLTHGISHLSRGHTAPHVLLCADCIASADAGAAPPSSVAPLVLVAVPPALDGVRSFAARAALPRASYRSRAPPLTLT